MRTRRRGGRITRLFTAGSCPYRPCPREARSPPAGQSAPIPFSYMDPAKLRILQRPQPAYYDGALANMDIHGAHFEVRRGVVNTKIHHAPRRKIGLNHVAEEKELAACLARSQDEGQCPTLGVTRRFDAQVAPGGPYPVRGLSRQLGFRQIPFVGGDFPSLAPKSEIRRVKTPGEGGAAAAAGQDVSATRRLLLQRYETRRKRDLRPPIDQRPFRGRFWDAGSRRTWMRQFSLLEWVDVMRKDIARGLHFRNPARIVEIKPYLTPLMRRTLSAINPLSGSAISRTPPSPTVSGGLRRN